MIMQHFVSRRRLYLAFLAGLHTAEPITKYQNHDTSKGRKTKIQRTKRNESPTAPETNQMTHCKTKNAEAKKQHQSPETSTADQMIKRAIKQRNKESKQKSWKCHIKFIVCRYYVLDQIRNNRIQSHYLFIIRNT